MATDITTKWGRPVAERGFAQLPNYLLFINQFLDKDHRLSPVELLVLFQLVGTWWKKGEMPFPSMGTLALRCGVSDRQIQRSVNELEKIGLLRRVNRRIKGIISSNAYDLAPLVEILEEIAKAFPNEFPRNVDRAIVKEISNRLGSNREPADRDRINIHEDYELRFWSQKLGVSHDDLKAAVEKVGVMAKDVEADLKRSNGR